MIKLLIPLLFLSVGSVNATIRKDSIGVEKNGDKYYILHRIDPKETLYSLSRKYHVTVDDIVSENPDTREGLKIASVVKIPVVKKQVTLPAGKKHVVQQSETLFAISKKYNVDIDRLAAVNHLQGYQIQVGQDLLIPVSTNPVQTQQPVTNTDPTKIYHTVAAGETLFAISRHYDVKVNQIRAWNTMTDNNLKPGQMIIVGEKKNNSNSAPVATPNTATQPAETPIEEIKHAAPEPSDENITASTDPVVAENIKKHKIEDNEYLKNKNTSSDVKIEKVFETGLAELIVGSDDTKKYLALHKTAPVGSILQVKNEMNDLSVFVRVIGKLPETGDTEKIKIRISKIAYEHLGAIDQRFPVEISYIPR